MHAGTHRFKVYNFQPFHVEEEAWLSLLLHPSGSGTEGALRFSLAAQTFPNVRIVRGGRVTSPEGTNCFPITLQVGPQDSIPDAVEILIPDATDQLLENDLTALAEAESGLLDWGSFRVHDSAASVVFCEHGVPQLVRKFEISFEDGGRNALSHLFANRPQELVDQLIAPLLQQGTWATQTARSAHEIFFTLVRCMHEKNPGIRVVVTGLNKCFPPYSDHIVLYSEQQEKWFESLHHRYENYSGISVPADALPSRQQQDGLHLGWGFSTIEGICEADAHQALRIVLYMQSSWIQLRFFRNYLINCMANPFALKDNLDRIHSVNLLFGHLLFAYERFWSKHGDYLACQQPKFFGLVQRIEARWHMKEDLATLRDSIRLTSGLINRVLDKSIEDRQKKRDLNLQLILTAGQALLIILAWNTMEALSIPTLLASHDTGPWVRFAVGVLIALIFFTYFIRAAWVNVAPREKKSGKN